jgi:hypothetical protein
MAVFVSDELDTVTKMLRAMCARFSPLPAAIATWWTAEQIKIAAETAEAARQRAERRAMLVERISQLQAQLDNLQ